MGYITKLAETYPSLVDGWVPILSFSGDAYYHWEKTLAGGFWDLYTEYIHHGSVSGIGYISGSLTFGVLWDIIGDINGVGYIYSAISSPAATIIYGNVVGVGLDYSKINFSRQRAIYPELRVNDRFDSRACPISAFEYVGFSPNKVINIISREDDIPENSTSFYTIETLKKNDNDPYFPLLHYTYVDDPAANKDYLITDITTTTQDRLPLFYQYELLFDAKILEDESLLSIYKNNETLVPRDSYVLQYSYDLISVNGRYSETNWGLRDPSETVHRVRILFPATINSSDFYTVSYKKSVYNAVSDQRELVELRPLYSNSDFTIEESGVLRTSESKLPSDVSRLYIIKDPSRRLVTAGIEPPVIQHDDLTSWFLRLNAGSFYIGSGQFNSNRTTFYNLSNVYNSENIPITDVKPTLISDDIIKVDQFPIYINPSGYVFPLYTIETYEPGLTGMVDTFGKIGVAVNGLSVPGLKILSIDRPRGYIQLNRSLNPTDNITLSFYVDKEQYVLIDNLELNPKSNNPNTLYHISDYPNGLGIAIAPYVTTSGNSHYLYLYDASEPEDTRSCYLIPPVCGTGIVTAWNEDFVTLAELNINRLSKDMVKITDARRIGGGISDWAALNKATANLCGFDKHEVEWYSNVGYYGGQPLGVGGSVIITIPSGVLFDARERWIASLSGIVEDNYEAISRGTREFNFYLDQVIKRYISAGTNYIIIPIDSSGNFMDILSLDF